MKQPFSILLSVTAVTAVPLALPQAVTEALSPAAQRPLGCSGTYNGTFGIAAMNISAPITRMKRQAPDNHSASMVMNPVSQVVDGQPQAPTAITMRPASPSGSGVVGDAQGDPPGSETHTVTMIPLSQIKDGQIQNPVATAYRPSSASAWTTSIPTQNYHNTQFNSTGSLPRTINASFPSQQPMVTPSTNAIQTSSLVSSYSTSRSLSAPTLTPTNTAAPASPSIALALVACQKPNSTLELALSDGVLTDARGRTGYIASNYQFQFDSPPQSGALYTSGWSICANDSLALGGSNVFYQCLSGAFYNLYSENWAPQCSPVTINALRLVTC